MYEGLEERVAGGWVAQMQPQFGFLCGSSSEIDAFEIVVMQGRYKSAEWRSR